MPNPDRFVVDLSNCDREPIHLLGAIQQFGFLIVLSETTWRVTRASQNLPHWIDRRPADVIGKQLEELFPPDAVKTIRDTLRGAILGSTVARAFNVAIVPGSLTCDIAVHANDGAIFVECEPSVTDPTVNSSAMVRGMVSRLESADDLYSFYRIAAREMHTLTAFDRVMIYRFDHDGSGEVIAESATSGVEPFLGLHYPASDIPAQARRLYERNWLRIIPDVAAAPSAIEPELDAEGKPLDLSMSVLRSVSPIHIEYLRNMGVHASMSVSILREGKLWGLFACHNYFPHHITFERRTAAELFGQMFSLMMENREREDQVVYKEHSRRLHNRVITAMAAEAKQFQSIIDHIDDLADLIRSDGVGLWIDGQATLRGLAPDRSQLADLVAYLDTKTIETVYPTNGIAAEYPAAEAFVDRAAGMLVVPLSRPARDFLIFFRKEVVGSVNWAGDPSKPAQIGQLGDRLTPRRSFELWKQTVRGQSTPWSAVEIRTAESLRVSLLEVILRLSDLTFEERRRSEERQMLLIAELNHRVRNILSLIRAVINQSRESATTIEMFTKVVGGRIQALARAHEQITSDSWNPASFHGLVATEAAAYLGGNADRLVIGGPDAFIKPKAFTTVALLIHEMTTNSAKYGALSDNRGMVRIDNTLEPDGNYLISWSELGGPPVETPTRRGFGTTVIERSVRHDLGGNAEIEFAPTGLRALFTIPHRHLEPQPLHSGERDSSHHTMAEASDSLPVDVLLVEDSVVIALDTEEILRKLGVATVRTASGVATAVMEIDQDIPDFALLDFDLGQETSIPVAERLTELNVPFVFTSAYGEGTAVPGTLKSVPYLSKPHSAEAIRRALASYKRGGA